MRPKIICATAPEKHPSTSTTVGDPVLGSPVDGIGGGYPITFTKDHQLPTSDDPELGNSMADLPRAAIEREPNDTAKPLSNVKSGIPPKFKGI